MVLKYLDLQEGPNVENDPIKKKATYGLGNNSLPIYGLQQLDDHT